MGAELTAELAMGVGHQHLPALQNLTYADAKVRQLLDPRCHAVLMTLPSTFADKESGQRWAHHLDHILRILDGTSAGQDRIKIASECEGRFAADPGGPLALVWLRGLFRFGPERGAQALETGLAAMISRPTRPS
jgi:hypothetical protein